MIKFWTLDFVKTNLLHFYDENAVYTVPPFGLSDHNVFIVRAKRRSLRVGPSRKVIARRHTRTSRNAELGRFLSAVDWSIMDSASNCEERSRLLCDAITFGLDTIMPAVQSRVVYWSSIVPPTSVTQVQLWPRVICGLSFSRSQPDSEGFSPGTPVFLPPQNRLAVNYIWLGLRCSEITHGSYDGSRGRLHMHSVQSRWAGWSWKALVGRCQLSAHSHNLPWITPEFKTLIAKRQQAFMFGDMDSYRHLRNEVNRERKAPREKYFASKVQHLKNTTSSMWWGKVKRIAGCLLCRVRIVYARHFTSRGWIFLFRTVMLQTQSTLRLWTQRWSFRHLLLLHPLNRVRRC